MQVRVRETLKFLLTAVIAALGCSLLLPSVGLAQTKRGIDKAIGFRVSFEQAPADKRSQLEEGVLAALKKAYGDRTEILSSPASSPTSLLYEAALKRLDHVILITGASDFTVTKEKSDKATFTFQVNGKARIIDLGKPSIGTDQDLALQGEAEAAINGMKVPQAISQEIGRQIISKMIAFYNPNTMGKHNLRGVADLFYEQKLCAQAVKVYELAIGAETQFDVQSEMEKRSQDCQKTLTTQQRQGAGYQFSVEYSNLSETFKSYYEASRKAENLDRVFQQYTDKPVSIRVSFTGEAPGSAPGQLTLSFLQDNRRFPAGRLISANQANAIDFSVYKAPLIYLVRFHYGALKMMPESQRKLFSQFAMKIRIEKVNGDLISYDLPMDRNNNPIAPRKLAVQVSGYSATTVEANGISSQAPHTFLLGPVQNIDGKETVFALLYRYFDLPLPK